MIRLNVFVSVAAENRSEVIALSKELVEASLKDNGCIAYDVFESSTRPEVLMICETWQDEESLKSHMAAEHFTRLVPAIEALAAMKLEQFVF